MTFKDLSNSKEYGNKVILKSFETLTLIEKKLVSMKKKERNIIVTLHNGFTMTFLPVWNLEDKRILNKWLPIFFSELAENNKHTFMLQNTAYNAFKTIYKYLCDNCEIIWIDVISL